MLFLLMYGCVWFVSKVGMIVILYLSGWLFCVLVSRSLSESIWGFLICCK